MKFPFKFASYSRYKLLLFRCNTIRIMILQLVNVKCSISFQLNK